MLKAHICFKPVVERGTREETKKLVIKALKVFFDDNGLSENYENVRSRLTSYTLWPQNKRGKKPTLEIIDVDDAYILSVTCDFDPITYGFYPSFSSFAFRLYDVLDCSPIIRLGLGGLTIDSENSEIKYAEPYEPETILYYVAPYVYGTKEEMEDKPVELDKDGRLYTMPEFLQAIDDDDISDYDGSCDLLYKKDGQWYMSQLDVSITYPLPEFIKTKYTHAMWYNK